LLRYQNAVFQGLVTVNLENTTHKSKETWVLRKLVVVSLSLVLVAHALLKEKLVCVKMSFV